MKKIVDERGVPIAGLFRNSNGGVVVDDKKSLNKYYMEQKNAETIISLEKRLEMMETVLKQLLEKNNG